MEYLLDAIKNSENGSAEIAKALKKLRIVLHLSVKSVAETLLLVPENISNLEQNKVWNKQQAIAIAIYYNFELLDMLYRALKIVVEKHDSDKC